MADDRELWERIRGRDERAFEAFYRENAPRLCAYLRQLVRSAQAAEDLTQDTFAKMWQSPDGFQAELGSLSGYLFGVGRKRAAEWWRREGRKQRSLGEAPRSLLDETKTNSACVSDALARLPEEQRSLLWLRVVEGQSHAELAAILDIPVGTVKSRLFAAREELRRIWHGSRERK